MLTRRQILSKVHTAISSGKLTRPEKCEICGSKGKPPITNCHNPWTGEPMEDIQPKQPIVAHHEDYEKPLDVIFVCRSCHYKIHKELI